MRIVQPQKITKTGDHMNPKRTTNGRMPGERSRDYSVKENIAPKASRMIRALFTQGSRREDTPMSQEPRRTNQRSKKLGFQGSQEKQRKNGSKEQTACGSTRRCVKKTKRTMKTWKSSVMLMTQTITGNNHLTRKETLTKYPSYSKGRKVRPSR